MKLVILLKLKILRSNLIVFLVFSVLMTFIVEKLPISLYSYKKWLFRERQWEKGGRFYEKHFFVKYWKCKLPEISDFIKSMFTKKHLRNNSRDYLRQFLDESCKAEFSHWAIIASSMLFFFWNGFSDALLILLVATLLNMPYIIIQRYNRPRIVRLLQKNPVHYVELAEARAHS